MTSSPDARLVLVTTAEDATAPVPSMRPPDGRWKRRVPTAASVLLGLGLTYVYATRPDACAAITVFPPWAWMVPGLGLAALGLRRRRNRGPAAMLVAWVAFGLAFSDEPVSLLRAFTLPSPIGSETTGEAIRVVSLNCAIGNRDAAGEVEAYRPDVVLLQESPGRIDVQRLAKRLFGDEAGVVYGVDASLIVRGSVTPATLSTNESGYFVQARVRLASGREIEVISTRLVPAVFRADLWSPDCWREQAENRRKRREQLGVIAQRMATSPVPVILGGDFNAPQGDAVFRLLRPRLHDSFREGGRGWGDTILNEVPVLRIDQVWADDVFHCRDARAIRTKHSDHRMVVCDLWLRRDEAIRK